MPTGNKESRAKAPNAPGLPEILGGSQYERITLWLSELGYCSTGFNGTIPLSFTEIAAWQQLTKTELTTWDVLTVRQLSEHYASQHQKSTDKSCSAPYRPGFETVEAEQANNEKVVSFFRRLPTVKR